MYKKDVCLYNTSIKGRRKEIDMRIKAELKTDKLPLAYRTMMIGLLKRCLEKADEPMYRSLYFHEGKKRGKTKPFSFSLRMKECKLKGEEFHTGGLVTLYVTSNNPEFLMTLYNGLMLTDEFEYKDGYRVTRQTVSVVPEYQQFSSSMTFATMSPLLVTDKNKKWIGPDEEGFERELNYIADLILRENRGAGLQRTLRFAPIEMKRIMVKESITEYETFTGKKYLHLLGYNGRFRLEGHPSDLQSLYQLGLSFRRNSGFGMLQVLSGGEVS